MRISVGALLLCLSLLSQIELRGNQSAYAALGVEIVESSHSRLVLEYTPRIGQLDTTYIDGSLTIKPAIVGTYPVSDREGAPPIYRLDIPVTVPAPESFALQTVSVSSLQTVDALMTPEPIAQRRELGADISYRIDREAFRNPASNSWASLSYRGIARDRHVASLSLVAADFDPASQQIRIPQRIRVTIQFLPTAVAALGPVESDKLVSTINNSQTKAWKIPGALGFQGKTKASDLTLNSENWLRIGIDEEGIYKIDAAALASAGIELAPGQHSTLKLYGYGGRELPEKVSAALENTMIEQAIIVNSNGAGELESIIFYASAAKGFEYENGEIQHFINHYSNRNYYMLTVGGSDGLRAEALEPPAAGDVVHRPSSYTARIFHEEDLRNPYNPGSGRRWFGVTVDQNIPATFFPSLPNLLKSDEVLFRFTLAHRSERAGSFDISHGGQFISSMQLSSVNLANYDVARSERKEVKVDAANISSEGALQFTYSSPSAGASAFGYIDWYEIHYPASFYAIDNELQFFDDNSKPGVTEYSANGFSGKIYGFDVSARARPKLLTNVSNTGGLFVFRSEVKFEQPDRYFVSSNLRSPASIDKARFSDVRNNHANSDVVVITNRDLLESANKYKEYRESTSEFSVAVITTEELFNEFAGGVKDPTAIRDYLAHAMETWTRKPQYVVIWGDGHYDFRGIQTTADNLIPTYQSYDEDGRFDAVDDTYQTEDYFVQVVGDDLETDIAIGRVPIVSNSEGDVVLDKIRRYEANAAINTWRTTITMIADDSPASDRNDLSLHTSQSETLSDLIPRSMRLKKIYLPDYPTENIPGGRRKPKVTQDLVSAINSGSLLVNWIGHGNPRVWAHERIFEKDETIPLFQNRDKLFFLTAATCDFGRFDDSERQSGAEELFTDPEGGVIGVFSSARTVYAHENAQINQLFYTNLFDNSDGEYLRLGDVMFRVKQRRTGHNDRKFFLLGDPTMRLLIPRQEVRITAIDGNAVNDTNRPQLKALSTVEIKGYVTQPGSSDEDASFNGTILLSLHDSDIQKDVVDIDNSEHQYTITGGLLNVSGAQIENGRFTTSIVVPKDISFSDNTGRLFGYAFSTDQQKFAKGASEDFTVGGIDTTVINDNKGPEIDIFVDTRTFVAGDYVNPIPLLIVDLFDETGVNATGLGIGHDIQAWVDDNPKSINLTSSYTVSLSDFRNGTAERELFDLSCGQHSIRVRAWDVFNNYSETETYFRIPCNDSPVLAEVVNYPNPFWTETKFSFRHSEMGSVRTDLYIYTSDAKLVRTLRNEVSTRSATIPWDGRDEEGNILPTGTYVYRLVLRADDGQISDFTGQVAFVR